MAIQDAGAAVIEKEDDGAETDDTPKPGRVKEVDSAGNSDPFAEAFNAAKDELEAADKTKAKPKPKAKEEPAKTEKKPQKAEGSEKKEAAYAKDEDGEEGGETEGDKPKRKGPLEPAKYWTEKRREAFKFQPREVQEEWLAADPEANPRWLIETKEAFATLPREAKELVLTQLNEADRGIAQKFQEMAGERKYADDMRRAVPAVMRGYIQRMGVSDATVFGQLLKHQYHSMTDPRGYVLDFMSRNNIDVLDLIPDEGSTTNSGHQRPQPQADVTSHPAFRALKAEYDALAQAVQGDRAQRDQEEDRRRATEFEAIKAKTDADGDSLYPYVRVLADPMARIIEANPDLFGSMGSDEVFSTAYNMAWAEHPELPDLKKTAKRPPADEQEEPAAHSDPDQERAEKLKQAIPPKSKTTHTPPAKTGAVSLDDALSWAAKQVGKR